MKLKNIRLIAFLLAFISLVVVLPGCEKDSDDDDPTPASIEGLWIGTYSVNGHPNVAPEYYSLIIKPDGTVVNETRGLNQQHFSVGNWALTGNSFTCTTTCVYGASVNIDAVQTHTATFDKTNGTITNGIWTDVVSPLNLTGTFTMTKVK